MHIVSVKEFLIMSPVMAMLGYIDGGSGAIVPSVLEQDSVLSFSIWKWKQMIPFKRWFWSEFGAIK